MKEIEFLLKLQGDFLAVLCSLFKNTVTFYEYNQEAIELTVSPQIQTCTKHITIKYHHIQIFFVNGDVEIKHVENK